MYNTKISKIIRIAFLILIVISFNSSFVRGQRYSVDHAPAKKIQWNIHPKKLFKKNPQRKAERKKRKEEKRKGYNEIRTFKKNWKKIDHPKELGTKRKVVKRMKKNLKVSKRINNNKHKDGAVKRLSRKKIKLPKISMSKIRWPWTKKPSNE